MTQIAGARAGMAPTHRRVTQRAPFGERRRSSILVGQRSLDLMAMESPGEQGPRFVRFVIRKFRNWGYFISEHDWKAIVICLIISGIGFIKVATTPQRNDITGYSPYGARAREEYTRYQEFFAKNGLGVAVYVFVLAKDGHSMLREPHLKESIRILDEGMEKVKLYNKDLNASTSFSEFCLSFCSINEPVRQFYNGFRVQTELAAKHEKLNGRIALQYPISKFFGRSFTLQQSFYGIDYYDDKQTAQLNPADDNATELVNTTALIAGDAQDMENGVRITNMKSAKIIVLQYRAEHQQGWTSDEVKRYELAMVEQLQTNIKSDHVKTYVLSQTYIEEEMVRVGISLLPYLRIGFLIMCICSVISVAVRALYMHQHIASKILLAVMACILPFMSCATALGLMFFNGIRFTSIICVIPFLVLAIGVDSSYLMIHEWQRVTKHCRDQPTQKNSNVGYRISEVLSEVGPAILISALTNVFADGVGAFTSSPEITLLCVGNMVSMVIAFFYQMTFYAGLFSIVGKYEIRGEREERRKIQASIRAAELSNGGTNGAGSGKHAPLTRQPSKFHETSKHYISKSMLVYVNFVASKAVALAIVAAYFVYLAVTIWGITRIQINLTSQKLFTADSPLLQLDKIRVEYQVPHFSMVTVFVNRPGNLSDPAVLGRMNRFVQDLEHVNGSWGPVGTQYFVRDFINFEESFEAEFNDEEPSDDEDKEKDKENAHFQLNATTPSGPFREADLKDFVEWPVYDFWSGFIKLDEKKQRLVKFFFTTAYHGKHLSIWVERGKFLESVRAVVDKYTGEFDASLFYEDAIFLDLIDNMPTDTWQSVVGTLICMGAVCFLFLNSIFTVVIASSCVLSICTGILGYLSWAGVDLDPITMAAMIISIGCSVDIPAHVSYHYYQASVRKFDATPQMKLVNCLSAVAFPAIQAGVSTILCVSSLLFVHIYMSEVFVKTMVLCVSLCVIHGLVFLPAFLILFDSVVKRLHEISTRAREHIHRRRADDAIAMRMGGEAPRTATAGASAINRQLGFADNRHVHNGTNESISGEEFTIFMCFLNKLINPNFATSTICDRPELHYAPEDPKVANGGASGQPTTADSTTVHRSPTISENRSIGEGVDSKTVEMTAKPTESQPARLTTDRPKFDADDN